MIIDVAIVCLLASWYSNQQACIHWHDKISAFFTLGNGTRQGGVLSPWFFARYVMDMWLDLGLVAMLVACVLTY